MASGTEWHGTRNEGRGCGPEGTASASLKSEAATAVRDAGSVISDVDSVETCLAMGPRFATSSGFWHWARPRGPSAGIRRSDAPPPSSSSGLPNTRDQLRRAHDLTNGHDEHCRR
jgi:hypothetical protein